MASTIQVVLKENLDNLGSVGDVVRVRRGYARNFLIPRGFAVMATRKNLKEVEHEKSLQAHRLQKLRAEQEATISKLEAVVLMIAKEAGEDGKLFGSVTAADVIAALGDKGVEVDKKKLVMPAKAIKEVGSYTVSVKYPYGLTGNFKLEVKTKS